MSINSDSISIPPQQELPTDTSPPNPNCDDNNNNDDDLSLNRKKRKKTNRLELTFDHNDQVSLEEGDCIPNQKRIGQSDNNNNKDDSITNTDLFTSSKNNQSLHNPDQIEPPALKFVNVNADQRRVQKLIDMIEKEWDDSQEKLKKEKLTVVFSWWDGSGHRLEVTINKGDTILQFLAAAQKVIIDAGFPQLSRVNPDQLMYIKEDLILPLHYTFYEFIASNARGKSGSLVHFGVKDDVRLQGDASIEKDDVHAGKIMEKSYYQAHKHQHPYDRFEPYDPKKSYDKYTIA